MKLLIIVAALTSTLIWQGGMAREEESPYRIHATSGKRSTVATLTFIAPDKIELIDEIRVGHHPSWITFDQYGNGAYVMGDNISYFSFNPSEPSEEQDQGNNVSETKAGENEYVSGCLVRGLLFIANYLGGSVTVRKVTEHDGTSHITLPFHTFKYGREGIGPVTSRQDKAYAHDAIASPDGGWVYICDLGSDKIHRIKVSEDDCIESVHKAGATSVAQGSGPRHLRFHRDETNGKQYAYLSSELSCTVTAFAHDPQDGKLTMIGQPILTVPQGLPLGGTLEEGPQRTTAEVTISPDGRYVYVSNRGDEVEDHITVLKRYSDGSLVYLDWFPTGGLKARHFSISSDGKYLAVAHETSGSIVVLERNEINGSLSKTTAIYKDLPGTQYAGFYPPQQYV